MTKTIAEIIDESSGIVREIYDHVFRISRELPEFQIAAALMIVGACTQRARVFPDSTGTNLNIILAGPSSTTKTFFLNYIQRYLAEVSPELVCPGFASEIGFQEIMAAGPSRCLAQDEIGQRIESAYVDKQESAKAWVLGLLKYSEPTNMPAQVRRSGTVPAVEEAVLSIAGAMTTDTLKVLFAKDKFIRDGLASRFLYFIHTDMLPISIRGMPRYKPVESIVKRLRVIYQSTAVAMDIEAGGASHDLSKRKPLNDPEGWIMAAKQHFVDKTQAQFDALERDEKELINSIRDRMVATVEKISNIHASGRGAENVDREDAQFACQIVEWLWNSTIKDILGFKDDETKAMEAIIHFFTNKKKAMTARGLKQYGPRIVRAIPMVSLHKMLGYLVDDRFLKIEDINGILYFTADKELLTVRPKLSSVAKDALIMLDKRWQEK